MPNDLGLVRSERAAIVASILRPYLTAKKDRTILQQYERVQGGPDGRVRTVLSPVVTETGRLASGESFIDPASTNLQNLSKKESYKDPLYRVRDCFIADPGMSLVACDLDKAEAVVVAFESQNWKLYEMLVEGGDPHRWVASHAYHGGNEKSVVKAERQRCKNVLYASFYMAGVPRITATINADATSKADRLTEADVQAVYNTIMELLDLQGWWDSVWAELMDPTLYGGVRWLENPLGLRRMFYNPVEHKLHKEAVNFFPQSTVAERINTVMEEIPDLDVEGEVEFLLQVHDELLFQVRDALVPDFARLLKSLMQAPFTARGRSVYIPASVEVGKRWDAHRDSDGPNTLGRLEALSL